MLPISEQERDTAVMRRNIDHAAAFTAVFRRCESAHPALREAACLRANYPAMLLSIREDDVFAGRLDTGLVGLRFSFGEGEIGYYCRQEDIARLLQRDDLEAQDREVLADVAAFWRTRTSFAVFTALDEGCSYPPAVMNALLLPGEGKNWENELFAATYMPRLAEINLDFDTLCTLGLPGLRERIIRARNTPSPDGEDELYAAMLQVLDLIDEIARVYAEQARTLAARTSDTQRRDDLSQMAAALEAITLRAPSSLREAIQLCWLYGQLTGIDNFGRMDVYLGDFYASDLATGRLNEAETLRLVSELWQLIGTVWSSSGRVIIGGRGRRNEAHADLFALAALEASRTVKLDSPQLSLRCTREMSQAVFDKALQVIGEGRVYPLLYNDDVYVPAISEAFGVPAADAEQYIMSNCGELNLDHLAVNSPNGSISYIKLLELTLFNGIDPVSGTAMGIPTGNFAEFHTFQELWQAFERQAAFILEVVSDRMAGIYTAIATHTRHLFASMLFDDCIARGKGLIAGARYRGFDIETHAAISVADALTAIKQVVFTDGAIRPAELLTMLRANFQGYEQQRRLLRNAAKFGNDCAEADEMAIALFRLIHTLTSAQAVRTGVDFSLPSHVSVDAYVSLGKSTGATPDGRLAGRPVSNGGNPMTGSDTTGATALLNSMAKLAPAWASGQTHHVKLTRALFTRHRLEVAALLRSYFAAGGCYLCINVADPQEMEDAMQHPEAHGDLFVRIGGFNARFITLSHELQEDIMARSLYEE